MKHEIDGMDLRECIDKSFSAGYKHAIDMMEIWLRSTNIFIYHGSDWGCSFKKDEFINDLKTHLEKHNK